MIGGLRWHLRYQNQTQAARELQTTPSQRGEDQSQEGPEDNHTIRALCLNIDCIPKERELPESGATIASAQSQHPHRSKSTRDVPMLNNKPEDSAGLYDRVVRTRSQTQY
eukprot:3334426-Amphidinium_carterae.2